MRLEVYGVNNLNFVEFNITGDNEGYQHCDKDSMFMDSELFNLYSECFEKSNNLYDYFGPTKYNARNIVVLLNELQSFFKKIQQIESLDSFLDFTGNIFLGANFVLELEKIDKSWRLNWELHCKKLQNINTKLITLVNRCIEEDRTLWIIGY